MSKYKIILGFALILLAVLLSCRMKISGNKNKTINVDQTVPDSAQGFGYKMMWLAVKTDDQHKLADFLKLKNIEKCNWKVGINTAYKFPDSSIFITPYIDGWTLACSVNMFIIKSQNEDLHEVKNLLKILSRVFGEAQYFFSFRTADCYIWMKAVNGKIARVYSICQGENISIEGEPTNFEKNYNFINTFSPEAKDSTYYERKDIFWPDEEFVMKVAENWSVDPSKLERRKDLFGKFGLIGQK